MQLKCVLLSVGALYLVIFFGMNLQCVFDLYDLQLFKVQEYYVLPIVYQFCLWGEMFLIFKNDLNILLLISR